MPHTTAPQVGADDHHDVEAAGELFVQAGQLADPGAIPLLGDLRTQSRVG